MKIVSNEELIKLLEEEKDGVNLDYDKYLNIATSLIDTLSNTQMNYLKILLNANLNNEEITDLKSEVYNYILNKMCELN